jgi:hypothetical protein
MDPTLTLIISLALAGGALAFILYPLWRQTRPEASLRPERSGQTLEEYQTRYQAALAAIRDLMFDYEMGKVSAEDYETLLPKTKLEAAKIRRQIDQLSHHAGLDVDPAIEAKIESRVAELKSGHLNGNETLLQKVEAEIELLKHIQLDPEAGAPTCPNCGQPFAIGDAFCSGCGQSLAEIKIEADENTCPECGHAFQPGDAFCAKCGTALDSNITTRKETSNE